jgi:tRNA A-37 threonylcarbamoyl transferase component Bud32
MSYEKDVISEFIKEIPIEDVLYNQDCNLNFTSLCSVKKSPGQDSFFDAIKIIHLEDKICKTEWEISETPIGEISQNATIYKARCANSNRGDKYALKYIGIKGRSSYELKNITSEINIQQKIYNKTGYTTPIYQIFLNNNYLMFVTDKLGMTVYRYIFNKMENDNLNSFDIKNIISCCYNMLYDLMTNHGIVHGDEHLNNFMVTEDFDDNQSSQMISKIKIIDFGKSYILPSGQDVSKMIDIRLNVIKSIMNANIEDLRYHKNRPSRLSDLLPDEFRD